MPAPVQPVHPLLAVKRCIDHEMHMPLPYHRPLGKLAKCHDSNNPVEGGEGGDTEGRFGKKMG
jgi:hypothetical protein